MAALSPGTRLGTYEVAEPILITFSGGGRNYEKVLEVNPEHKGAKERLDALR